MADTEIKGVDLSNYQAGLDLSSLKKAGISFAILKVSEGKTFADPHFRRFYEAAKKAQLPVGAYVFSYATTPQRAKEEAEAAIALLKGCNIRLGVFMDVETTPQLTMQPRELTDTVKAFCDTVRSAGFIPGLYGSEFGVWSRVISSELHGVLSWVANWSRKPGFPCDFWQTSDHGNVPGFIGAVDMDAALSKTAMELISAEEQAAPAVETPTAKEPSSFDLHEIPALRHGDTGDAVKALQGELIAFGYSCGGKKDWRGAETPDGIFGNVTQGSVQAFQRLHNIADSGIANAETRAALICGVAEEVDR